MPSYQRRPCWPPRLLTTQNQLRSKEINLIRQIIQRGFHLQLPQCSVNFSVCVWLITSKVINFSSSFLLLEMFPIIISPDMITDFLMPFKYDLIMGLTEINDDMKTSGLWSLQTNMIHANAPTTRTRMTIHRTTNRTRAFSSWSLRHRRRWETATASREDRGPTLRWSSWTSWKDSSRKRTTPMRSWEKSWVNGLASRKHEFKWVSITNYRPSP